MKTIKKLVAAIALTTLLIPATHVHAMNEAPKKITAQEMQQHLNFSLGLFVKRINQTSDKSVAEIIELLKEGADVNATYLSSKDTIAKLACEAHRPDVLKILVLAGANLDQCISSPSWKCSIFERAVRKVKTKKQKAINSLNDLQALLRDNLIQNPHLPKKNVAQIVAEYALPYYSEPEYELLNDFVACEWTQIKEELEISRIIEQAYLPDSAIVSIVDGYIFTQRDNGLHKTTSLEAATEKTEIKKASAQEAPQLTPKEQDKLNGELENHIIRKNLSRVITALKKGAHVTEMALQFASVEACQGRPNVLKLLASIDIDTAPIATHLVKYPQLKTAIIEAQTTKQKAIESLNTLRMLLHTSLAHYPHLSVAQVADIVTDDDLSYHDEPEYELLNDFVDREWTRIKEELEISRIIEQSFLPIPGIVDIIDDYAFTQQGNAPALVVENTVTAVL